MPLLDRILTYITTTRAWVIFARHWLGHLTFRIFGYTKFPMEQYYIIEKAIESAPDGIFAFVSADTSCLAYKANHLLTKCQWSHAGLIRKGDDGHLYAWHMKGDGLNCWHLLNVLKQCDRFAAGRLRIEGDNLLAANARLDAIIGDPLVPYDYRLEIPQDVIDWLATGKGIEGDKERLQSLKLYCSELCYVVGAGLANPDMNPTVVHSRRVYEPDSLFSDMEVLFFLDKSPQRK
jgi:hypothetical protein